MNINLSVGGCMSLELEDHFNRVCSLKKMEFF